MIDVEILTVVLVSVPAFLLIGFTVVDVVRRRDLSSGRRALWMLIVVLVPVVGTAWYMFVRPLHIGRSAITGEDRRVTWLLDLLDQREAGLLGDAHLHDGVRSLLREGAG